MFAQLLAVLAVRHGNGDACLPLDVVSLLKGETTDAVAFACRKEIQEGMHCSMECYDTIVAFQAVGLLTLRGLQPPSLKAAP